MYDAILIVGFGGPEKRDDVIPFLENVLRGRNVPRERMLQVAGHYDHFGGKSPINDQVRELIAALEAELEARGVALPVYWGNRNWHPLLPDAMRRMADVGVRHALGLVLAAYSSYSSCRQYRENVEAARASVGDAAPQVDKVRVFYNHPEFIAANVDRMRDALAQFPAGDRDAVHVAYTAHSIPRAMADGCDYVQQLQETSRLVSEALGIPDDRRRLVYQSRSGRPQDPWLGPDICDHLADLSQRGVQNVIVMPIGFLSDHLEVLFDLDETARRTAESQGLRMVRAATVGTHPRFVGMLCELIQERLADEPDRCAIGRFGPNHDVCPPDCCPPTQRPAARPAQDG
ncbi:MAG: ferrochelatase [Planctomycetaceae bacterium]